MTRRGIFPRTKPCVVCGATMTQRRHESIVKWDARRYCSYTCAKTQPCVCGKPGSHVVQGQRLCTNCLVEMIVSA